MEQQADSVNQTSASGVCTVPTPLTPLDVLELVQDTASREWQSADGKRHAAVGNDGERFWFITEGVMREVWAIVNKDIV